jgi:hypothetical protein
MREGNPGLSPQSQSLTYFTVYGINTKATRTYGGRWCRMSFACDTTGRWMCVLPHLSVWRCHTHTQDVLWAEFCTMIFTNCLKICCFRSNFESSQGKRQWQFMLYLLILFPIKQIHVNRYKSEYKHCSILEKNNSIY